MSHRLARRALERQLEYQQKKAVAIAGRESDVMAAMKLSSQRVRSLLEKYQRITTDSSVIEVGSGAHGLIFSLVLIVPSVSIRLPCNTVHCLLNGKLV